MEINQSVFRKVCVFIILGLIFINSKAEDASDNLDATFSQTLPVLFINTENEAPIVSKDTYVNAAAYLETFGIEGYEALGSSDEPLELEIKGRGNSSWKMYDKKPYRLKFAKKHALMGMNKSKHFTLIPHVGGYRQHQTEAAGFEMGRMLGLEWTPEIEPIEVVINGEYLGMYLLTEQVRVDETRVNIFEQADSAVASEDITGGWLVEIDNYTDSSQITFLDGNKRKMRITYKSPEKLSPEQESYLMSQFVTMDSIIFSDDKDSSLLWDKYIDIDALVRFYIVQEILDNADAFRGSTYLHKDKGNDSKWVFGPLWDVGYAFWRTQKEFLYTNPKYGHISWIGEIAKYPQFQQHVREVWKDFYENTYSSIYDYIDAFGKKISGGDKADAARWPQYNKGDTAGKSSSLKSLLRKNTNWLNEQWGQFSSDIDDLAIHEPYINIQKQNGILLINTERPIESVNLFTITGTKIQPHQIDDAKYQVPKGLQGICIVEVITDNATIRCKYYF